MAFYTEHQEIFNQIQQLFYGNKKIVELTNEIIELINNGGNVNKNKDKKKCDINLMEINNQVIILTNLQYFFIIFFNNFKF